MEAVNKTNADLHMNYYPAYIIIKESELMRWVWVVVKYDARYYLHMQILIVYKTMVYLKGLQSAANQG